jgi:hypothetical protein
MNSFDDIIIDKTELNDFGSLRQRIEDMNIWIRHLDEEIHSYHRRFWINHENMIDLAHILEKIITEFGEDRFQEIVDDYMQNERDGALKKERQMAKNAELNFEFVDLEELFSMKL